MDTNKALLITGGWMGDFVWMIPTIRALSKKFESLALLVSEQQQGLARSLADAHGLEQRVVDKVWVDYKNDRFANGAIVAREARREGIGTYIDIVGKGKTGWYIPWVGNSKTYIPSSTDTKEYWPAKLLHPMSRTMPSRKKCCHYVDSYLSILDFFGIKDYKIEFNLVYDQITMDIAEGIIAKNRLRDQDSVVLNLSSAQFSKIWPAERFKKLASELSGLGLNVVIMGADRYRWNKNYDWRTARELFTDYDGLVLIKPLMINAYLLSSGVFKVSVGCDSFANHMAGSTNEVNKGTKGAVAASNGRYFLANTRTVTLMGPTNPFFCGVYDPTKTFHRIVKPYDYHGYNCLSGACNYNQSDGVCPNYGRITAAGMSPCMNSIGVSQVVDIVKEQLQKTKS